MDISNSFKRIVVRLLRIKPKILTDGEKKKVRHRMIEANRRQDRDITTCRVEMIEDLSLNSIELPNASGWLVSKAENPEEKIVYYIHGGGFVGACTKERMAFVSALARDFGCNVFSIDYRLAPEFMHPCALYDCFDGYEWLLQKYSPENILLLGESAGGTLVLTLSLLLRDRGLPLPKAVYSNSPVTQLADYAESFDRFSLKEDFIITKGIIENTEGLYFNNEEAKDPYVSPLYADLKGLPPIFLTASECECLLDDSRIMYNKLLEAGNDTRLKTYPGLCHAFIISPQMKDVVRLAYPDLLGYINEQLGRKEKRK